MNKKVLLAVSGLVLAGAIGFAAYSMSVDTVVENTEKADVEEQLAPEQVSEDIEFSEDGRVVTYSGRDDETALQVLRSLTTVSTEESDFGDMVITINGVSAGEGEFWAFYVNGKQASEGAGTYETTSEDEIEWRLESF